MSEDEVTVKSSTLTNPPFHDSSYSVPGPSLTHASLPACQERTGNSWPLGWSPSTSGHDWANGRASLPCLKRSIVF